MRSGRGVIRRWCRWARRPRSRPWPRKGFRTRRRIRQRDQAVQEFFGTLVGVEPDTIRVFGEELEDIAIPGEAAYPKKPGSVDIDALDVSNVEAVRQALCRLAGLPGRHAHGPGCPALPAAVGPEPLAHRPAHVHQPDRGPDEGRGAGAEGRDRRAAPRRGRGGPDDRCRVAGRHAGGLAATRPSVHPGRLAVPPLHQPGLRQAVPDGRGEVQRLPPRHGTALPLPQLRGRLPAAGRRSRSAPCSPAHRPDEAPNGWSTSRGGSRAWGRTKRTRRTKAATGRASGRRGAARCPEQIKKTAAAGRLARPAEPPLQHQPGRLSAAGDARARSDPLPLLRRYGREPQRHHAGEPGHVGRREGGRRRAGRGPGRGQPGPARPRRQGTAAGLQRQPPGRRPPGPVHHLRQPLRPDA